MALNPQVAEVAQEVVVKEDVVEEREEEVRPYLKLYLGVHRRRQERHRERRRALNRRRRALKLVSWRILHNWYLRGGEPLL